jgi:hypothetical protein
MANKFSQIPVGAIFNTKNGTFKKKDEMYYEDLGSGFESVWDPMFDASIEDTGKIVTVTNESEKYITDPATRMVKLNPNYRPDAAQAAFKTLYSCGFFDCAENDYDTMVSICLDNFTVIKALAHITGQADNNGILSAVLTATKAAPIALPPPVRKPAPKLKPAKKTAKKTTPKPTPKRKK